MSQTQSQSQRHHRRQSGASSHCLHYTIRIIGLLTAIVICGVGVDVYMHNYQSGLIILIASIFLMFLETKWIITAFIELLHSNDRSADRSCSSRLWNLTKLCDSWPLSIPYTALGLSLIISPHNLWLSYFGGSLIILLALLRLYLIYQLERYPYKMDLSNLLPNCDFEKIETGPVSPEDDIIEDNEPIEDKC